jgi:hypothetical protein
MLDLRELPHCDNAEERRIAVEPITPMFTYGSHDFADELLNECSDDARRLADVRMSFLPLFEATKYHARATARATSVTSTWRTMNHPRTIR